MESLAKLVLIAAFSFAPAAAAVTYTASLSGPAENPPNASPGTGSAIVTLDTTAHTMRVQVSFSGLTSGTTASHIHCCVAPPGTAGVATTTPTFPSFPLGVTAGAYDQTFNTLLATTWNAPFITANGGTPAGAEAALAAGIAAGQAYLNVHTTNFPSGEIRGFLAGQSAGNAASIPTLSQWALILAAVLLAAGALFALRRRLGE